MPYETILFTIENGVARLTLNRPERLNAFTLQMHAEVSEALSRAEAAGDLRVLVLTGAGRGFCAGQDLTERVMRADAAPPDLGESVALRYNPLVRRLVELPAPVVCAVNGVAAGAGANLALAADIVIATRSARFIQSFANIGLLPDAGGTWRLPRLVGGARAAGLALTGEALSAEKAEAWGLIWRCVDDADFQVEVEALVARLATAATRGLGLTKAALSAAWTNDLPAQLALEARLQRELGRTADYGEGVTAFAEKRPPNFQGR